MRNYVSARILSVAALSLGILSVPALAQDMSQLRQNVANELSTLNVTIPGGVGALSDESVRQIEQVTSSADYSVAGKRQAIMAIVTENVPCSASPALRSDVASRLQRMNVDVGSVDDLSGQQVVEMNAVLRGTESESAKREMIHRIAGTPGGAANGEQLRAEVAHCLRTMNIDAASVEALTPQEVSEIELILGSSESETTKREQIGRVIDN